MTLARTLRGGTLLFALLVARSAEAQLRTAANAERPVTTMTIGRLHYDGGGDWYANPSSLPNLLSAIAQRTGLRVGDREKVVQLSDDEIWTVPYLHMTGHGNVHFSDAELTVLRRWILQGGFLHASDKPLG